MYYDIPNPHGGDIYEKNINLDFSANVNPFGAPRPVIDAASDALRDAALYPDPYCRRLTGALSASLGLPKEMIYAGSGASELIYAYCSASSFKRAVVLSPTFLEYAHALHAAGTEVIPFIMKKENGFLPDDTFVSMIAKERPDAVFLCNPNNPTGQTLSPEMMKKILDAATKIGASLFVDECFYELSDRRVTMKDFVGSHDNLFILRAFTKSFALASLRLGYALTGNRALLRKMSAITPPWSISGPAEAAGVAALAMTDYPAECAKKLQKERKWLTDALSAEGITVWTSDVNYIFLEAREDLQERLRERGIEIRSCANYKGLGPGYFRIAVRLHEDNEALVRAVGTICRPL